MFKDRANLIILLIAVAGATGGFFLSRAMHSPPVTQTMAGTMDTDGERMAPAIELPDLDGERRSLNEWRGTYVLINFWATWCAPCRKEMPELVEVREALRGSGFEVIGIAIDEPEPAAAMVAELGVTYPILVTDMTRAAPLMTELGNQAGVLPFTVLVDPDGKLDWLRLGPVTHDELMALMEPRLPSES